MDTSALYEKRRGEILEAALQCFSRQGFHSTAMKDIAASMGMSVGNLYNYFQGKDDIVEELTDREIERVNALIEKGIGDWDIQKDRRNVYDLVLSRLDSRCARLMLEILGEAARNRRLEARINQLDALWRKHLLTLHMLREPALTAKEAAVRVEVDIAMIDGLTIRALAHPDVDPKAVAEEVCRRLRLN